MDFIPEDTVEEQSVPYYQDADKANGWAGHTTGKTIKSLQREIRLSMERLGGHITGFKSGTFTTQQKKREGFQVHFILELPGDDAKMGRLDIAALPVRAKYDWQEPKKTHREKSLRMALFMLRDYLNGLWYIRQLSPGFATLMPFIIDSKSGKTFSQLWGEGVDISHQLTSGEFKSDEPWWEILEVDKQSAAGEIQSAYRALAKDNHPDSGGNHEKFTRIQQAYDEAIIAVSER